MKKIVFGFICTLLPVFLFHYFVDFKAFGEYLEWTTFNYVILPLALAIITYLQLLQMRNFSLGANIGFLIIALLYLFHYQLELFEQLLGGLLALYSLSMITMFFFKKDEI